MIKAYSFRILKSAAGRKLAVKVCDKLLVHLANFVLLLHADDWNIYWANPWTVKQIFNPETGHRLGETQ